jgi:glyoxylase-like metal-dependent hydrolase (beta-lactamase superfamily II)
MHIHHLSCGSLCPRGRRLINGDGGLLEAGTIVCHCLLIEAADCLVLIDTGFGTGDISNPRQLGVAFNALMRPEQDAQLTALRQIEALGLEASDVRHIVVTHLDLDHAGGLPDFPAAQVHVFAPELEAALHPGLRERSRYIGGAHWTHKPHWAAHSAGGDHWFGFESVRVIPEIDVEVVLVPLIGHSTGHAAVAVNSPDGWLLHCGDAYFNHHELDSPPSCPPALRLFQSLVATDNSARKGNRERLRELISTHSQQVSTFCAHDPAELEDAQA